MATYPIPISEHTVPGRKQTQERERTGRMGKEGKKKKRQCLPLVVRHPHSGLPREGNKRRKEGGKRKDFQGPQLAGPLDPRQEVTFMPSGNRHGEKGGEGEGEGKKKKGRPSMISAKVILLPLTRLASTVQGRDRKKDPYHALDVSRDLNNRWLQPSRGKKRKRRTLRRPRPI